MKNKATREYLTTEQLAQRWQMSVDGLMGWRKQRRGPGYVKIGVNVRYPIDSVIEFEKSCFQETREQKRGGK